MLRQRNFITASMEVLNKQKTLRGFGLMTVIWCPLAARAFMMAWNGN
jgi:hypothetical protein